MKLSGFIKHTMRKLQCLALAAFVTLPALSQGGTIKGTVTTSDLGDPLALAHVVIKGSTTGVTTDNEGRYSIAAPESGSVLVYSYVGYNTVEVVYTDQTIIDVKLDPEITEMDQVIVIGYGTVKKSDLTGAVSVVSTSQMAKTNAPSLDRALQGKATGVMVSSTSGRPGSEPTVKIRGIGSINRE